MNETLGTIKRDNIPNLELLKTVIPTSRERNEASHLVCEALANFNSDSTSKLINDLYNNGGDEKAGVLSCVDEIVRRAKYFNGSEIGTWRGPEGLDAWKEAVKHAEALFYTQTQVESMSAKFDKLTAEQYDDDPEREALRKRVLEDTKEKLQEALQAEGELMEEGNRMRERKLSVPSAQ